MEVGETDRATLDDILAELTSIRSLLEELVDSDVVAQEVRRAMERMEGRIQ
jgi:hypothetical protein